jgi:hypothetical protein
MGERFPARLQTARLPFSINVPTPPTPTSINAALIDPPDNAATPEEPVPLPRYTASRLAEPPLWRYVPTPPFWPTVVLDELNDPVENEATPEEPVPDPANSTSKLEEPPLWIKVPKPPFSPNTAGFEVSEPPARMYVAEPP